MPVPLARPHTKVHSELRTLVEYRIKASRRIMPTLSDPIPLKIECRTQYACRFDIRFNSGGSAQDMLGSPDFNQFAGRE